MSLNTIKNQVCFDNTIIFFSHEGCNHIEESDKYILLKEYINTCNTLTKFEIFTENQKFLIYFHWSNSFTIDSISFYFSEPTSTLFLATNEVIYTIILSDSPVITNTYELNISVMCFWRFEKHFDFILALCETDVRTCPKSLA
jgi:hypothetical protein